MRNPTDLMHNILTDEMAQQIIDYVSPIYGRSYVGLWIYQAIGTVLGRAYTLADNLKNETNPMTSTLLLDYWESHYALAKDPTLTMDQRRERLATKVRSQGPCNPAKLAAAVSNAVGGLDVEIMENVAKNTFLVTIRGEVESFDQARTVIERMKPAHLIYQIQVTPLTNPTADINVAVALTHGEMFTLPTVEQSGGEDLQIYVDGETLVINDSGVQVDGETILFNNATVVGETLVIGGTE